MKVTGVCMTKIEIGEEIRERAGVTCKEANELMEAALSIIKDTLAKGDMLKIPGFGNFSVRKKNDRRGRNPQTGEAITISARSVLTYKPSKLLRDEINR